ncbi:MAG: S8 family peptidase [bacterium]|nr:S8 family peptidase [bacterium]
MNIPKKAVFALFLATFLAFLPFESASADSGRFFVQSTSNFWKTALGARNVFEKGFSADLSDFQFRFAKIFGLKVEPVDVLNILQELSPSPTPFVDPIIPSEAPLSAIVKAASESLPIPTPAVDTSGKNNAKGRPPIQREEPSDQTPWGIEAVYNSDLIASTSGGFGVSIAILDTGITITHPDLKNRIDDCKDFTSFKSPIVNGKCEDKNGHGTHVAGIIVADAGSDGLGIYGIAPLASVSAFKVCGNNGSCFADDIAVAIRHAADNSINIINMSFGSDADSSLIRDAVNYAASRGVLMVAASGNDGPFVSSIDYPAAYSSVIGVGAFDSTIKITEWSSRGDNSETEEFVVEEKDIEFAMPGENIESTWSNNGYTILSGTSMASPFLTGLAAKYWQADAEDSAAATREFLHSLAQDVDEPGDDDASGWGFPRVK